MIPDPGPDPHQAFEARQRADRVQAALGAPPPAFREILVLREAEGLDYNEIAIVLGLAPGTRPPPEAAGERLMDSRTERLLNLYLDGLLSGKERLEFEERTRRDPALRRAFQMHRQAAREMARMPDLPSGFTAAARARLERERPASVPAGWFHRFWSLEAAGLAAAAILVAAVLYPVLQNRPPEETLASTDHAEPPPPIAGF